MALNTDPTKPTETPHAKQLRAHSERDHHGALRPAPPEINKRFRVASFS